jgi:pentatricopeptide repeat protein
MTCRETFLGGNESDTATTYNNLACCYMKLGRGKEAYDYYNLAELIFTAQLGAFHERTLVVINLNFDDL